MASHFSAFIQSRVGFFSIQLSSLCPSARQNILGIPQADMSFDTVEVVAASTALLLDFPFGMPPPQKKNKMKLKHTYTN